MKYFAAVLGLLFWLAATVALTLTILGIFITWTSEYLDIPKKFLKVFEQ